MEWLLIVVVIWKRLEQQNTVEALNGDRDALKKEGRFFVLSWDRRNASSKSVDEINSLTIHGTKILYCDWLKAVVRERLPVFFHFSLCCLLCHCTRLLLLLLLVVVVLLIFHCFLFPAFLPTDLKLGDRFNSDFLRNSLLKAAVKNM